MALYSNPGRVDVKKAAEAIVEGGGGITSSQKDGYIHHTAYSRDENRHLSWDEFPDGSNRNVHTDKDNKAYTQYKDSK